MLYLILQIKQIKMWLFNKNYFKLWYFKKWNIFWQVSKIIRQKEDNLSKNIQFFNQALHIIFKLPKGAKVLDVWCWVGNWLKLIHKYRPDIQLYWVDIWDVEEFLPKYINFTKVSGDNLPFEDNYFDYVTCFHVLEHILTPQNFVKEFFRVLKPWWYCYIETPHIVRLFFPDKWNFYNDYTHIKPYPVSWLIRLIKDYNFNYIKWWKARRNYFVSFVLILLSPIIFLKAVIWLDRWAFYTLLDFIFWWSCFVIWQKTNLKS